MFFGQGPVKAYKPESNQYNIKEEKVIKFEEYINPNPYHSQ